MAMREVAPARPPKRRVDGVVLLDKPLGLTSNAALQRVKRAYNALKAGHTGTLDPLASGLLPICIGEATKFSMGLLDADKGYRTVLRLGERTETGDAEGAVVELRPVSADLEAIERAATSFRGNIMQVPHRYSALKRDGRALYSYARAGEQLEIPPRPVSIHSLVIENWSPPFLELDILCSKGTYIRSLGEDLGEALGCGAHVVNLRRTQIGQFGIARAVSLAMIETGDDADRLSALLPVSSLVDTLPQVRIDDEAAARFCNGQQVLITLDGLRHEALVSVRRTAPEIACDAGFLGIARSEFHAGQWILVPARLLATGSGSS